MPTKVQLYPHVELSGGDYIVGNPDNYGLINTEAPAECVDARGRTNRDNSLLVMRGPAGGQAFYYVGATLRTVGDLRAISAGTKEATTTYDALRAKPRQGERAIRQVRTMHTGNCRRSVHDLEVEGRINNPSSHTKEELRELAEVYAPRLGVLASDLEGGFQQVSIAAGHQVARLEAMGSPSQAQLIDETRRAHPGIDTISDMIGEPTAHRYLINHHRTRTLNANTDGEFPFYVDTPGAMIDKIQRTWELPKDELIIAASAVLNNSLATQDTLTVAHPNGGMINYESHEAAGGGLFVVRHDLRVPDGFNV